MEHARPTSRSGGGGGGSGGGGGGGGSGMRRGGGFRFRDRSEAYLMNLIDTHITSFGALANCDSLYSNS